MYICPQKLANHLLCCSNVKLPINKNHYITGKDISIFSKLICIENQLSDFTCNLKGYFNNCKSYHFR